MVFVHVEGTQEEKPLEFDATTSKSVVYIRKNIERLMKMQDDTTYEVWAYDEAQLPMNDFNAIASALVSEQGEAIKAVTPYKETKNAYIEDTEVIFNDHGGLLSVYVNNTANSTPTYTVLREDDHVVVSFDEPLEYVTEVTLTFS